MITSKCPGQDTRYWKAEDIHEQPCPNCGSGIEFWKTDIRVRCSKCKQKIVNSRFNLGCAQWCAFAEQCLGPAAAGKAPLPIRKLLEDELTRRAAGHPRQVKEVKDGMMGVEDECRKNNIDPLPMLAAIVTAALQRLEKMGEGKDFMDYLVEEYGFPLEAVKETLTLTDFIVRRKKARKPAEKILQKKINCPGYKNFS